MSERRLKVAVKTMGCRVNAYDSSRIVGSSRSLPVEFVDFDQKADVYLVNSCTVTAGADNEVRHLVKRARKKNEAARVVVTGCMASRAADDLLNLPEVDAVFPNLGKPDIPRYLARLARKLLDLETPPEPDEAALPDISDRSRPLVKVQEGCEQNCAFCIIPTTRGRERSRPVAEVVREVSGLLEAGAREVVLTGVHLGSYGRDLEGGASLAALVRALDRLGRFRLRLSSLEPWGLSEELLETLAASPSFCQHLHLPLQSGDRGVLQAMGRPYTPERYEEIIRRAVSFFPRLCIGTDVIVGFPGEDEDAFLQTRDLLQKLPIAYFHVFPYSVRPGTRAASMPGAVSTEEARRRSKILRELGSEKKNAFIRSFLGQEVEVLAEGRRDRATGLLRGISREYLTVLFEGPDSLLRETACVRLLSVQGSVSRGVLEDEGLGLSVGALSEKETAPRPS